MSKNLILKNFTKYVSLNVLGMICLSCYILADTFFVAKALGTNGLTALNFCISVFSILQGFGLMIGIGGATRYAISKNKDEPEEANLTFTHSLFTGFCAAIIFVFVGVFLTTPLSKLLGADTNTLPLTKTYMTTVLCFSPFFLLNNILVAFIRNDNNPKLAMAGMVASSFSNIVLDYIFMFPLSMGMFGAAFATGLSPIISICILSLHFWKKNNQFRLYKCKIRIKKIIDIILLGTSAFIGELSSAIALITFNLVILSLEGNIGVAAYGIVANIALIATSVFTGVAQGIQPLISKGHGSGDNVSVKQILKYAITAVFLLAIVLYGTTYFYSDNIVMAFNNEANSLLAQFAISGIKIYFTGFIFAGMNIIIATYFSAIANAKMGFIISILRSCIIIIPMVIILSVMLKMNGVWLSFVLTEFIVSMLSITFLYKNSKRYMDK